VAGSYLSQDTKQEPAVKLAISLAAVAATAALALSAPAFGASPELRLPDLEHLRAKATETVDVDVGGFLLGLARMITREEAEHDPALRLLHDIKSVKVRSYKFDSDDAYDKSDLDSVRRQLRGSEWSSIANVHKREPREDVDVYVCMEDGKTCGLAVIAAQARELTIVNIVGSIDIDRLAELEGQFGIPKTTGNQ
jgi:hypothetical protein